MKKIIVLLALVVGAFAGCKKQSAAKQIDSTPKTVIGQLYYESPAYDGGGGYYKIDSLTGNDALLLIDEFYQGHSDSVAAYNPYLGKKTRLVYVETDKTGHFACQTPDCPALPLYRAVSFTVIP